MVATGPLDRFDPAVRRRLLWGFGVAAVGLWAFLAYQDTRITASGGPGIVPFELAGSQERAQEILGEWGQSGRDAARASLVVDFAFMACYGVALAAACTAAAGRLRERGLGTLAGPGTAAAWAAVAAAAFDALENVALLRVVDGATETWPRVAQLAAIAKFALLAACTIYLLAALVAIRRARPS